MKPFGGSIGEKIQQECLLKTEANDPGQCLAQAHEQQGCHWLIPSITVFFHGEGIQRCRHWTIAVAEMSWQLGTHHTSPLNCQYHIPKHCPVWRSKSKPFVHCCCREGERRNRPGHLMCVLCPYKSITEHLGSGVEGRGTHDTHTGSWFLFRSVFLQPLHT